MILWTRFSTWFSTFYQSRNWMSSLSGAMDHEGNTERMSVISEANR